MINKIKFEYVVELMKSDNYKDRFVAEYITLRERYEKLKAFNTLIEAAEGTRGLDVAVKEPKHDCPLWLLREQQAAMGEYLHWLEMRAVIENIDLREIEAYYVSKSIEMREAVCQGRSCESCREEENNAGAKPDEEVPEDIYPIEKLLVLLRDAVRCEKKQNEACIENECSLWKKSDTNNNKRGYCSYEVPEIYEAALYYLEKLWQR